MNKTWLVSKVFIMIILVITAILMVLLCIFSASAADEEVSPIQYTENQEKVIDEKPDFFLTSSKGMVTVYSSDNTSVPFISTDIPVSSLRNADKALVEKGIYLDDYRNVLEILEDFGS